jgi:hypothetical protein
MGIIQSSSPQSIPTADLTKLGCQISFDWLKNKKTDTEYIAGYKFDNTREANNLFGVDNDGCLHIICDGDEIYSYKDYKNLFIKKTSTGYCWGYRCFYIVKYDKDVLD